MVEVEITMVPAGQATTQVMVVVLAKVAKALQEEDVVVVVEEAAAVPMVGVEGDLVMEALGTKLNYPRYLTYILQLGQFCSSN